VRWIIHEELITLYSRGLDTYNFVGFAPSIYAMKSYLASAALLLASPAMAANYATCILDKAPAAQNDVAAHAIMQSCLAEHPVT